MKKHTKTLLATLLTSALLATSNFAAAEKISVNGQAIPEAYYDFIIKQQKVAGAPDSKELKEAVKTNLIINALLEQEAKKKGLDKKSDYQTEAALIQQKVLIDNLLRDYVKNNPISDAKLKDLYKQINQATGDKEYKVKHILVADEATANDVLAKLAKGEKFAALAKANSKDPGSSKKGGELGWTTPNIFVPEFAAALKNLKKGETTKTAVKTDFGYHIISVEDIRKLTPPPFDKVKNQLRNQAEREQIDQYIESLRKNAKIN